MKSILYIGNKLSRHGYSPTSIETLGQLLEENQFKMYYASDKLNKILRILDMVYQTIKLKNKIDYVIIDTYSTTNFYYSLIISQFCRILNVKYIPYLHGGDLIYRFKKSKYLCHLILQNSFNNIAPSCYFFDFFKNKGYKIIEIPNFINLNNYRYKNRTNAKPNILWVRALQDIYNPKMAINSFELLKRDFPEATLSMVGAEKNISINELELYASKKNLKVNFTGRLNKKDWIKYAENFDIFINTSNFDNTPVSVIEAMALGLAVVSTNAGGIPYLFKDKENILICEKNDYENMYQLIKYLIVNPKYFQKNSQNARIFVEKFHEKHIIKLWSEVLK